MYIVHEHPDWKKRRFTRPPAALIQILFCKHSSVSQSKKNVQASKMVPLEKKNF